MRRVRYNVLLVLTGPLDAVAGVINGFMDMARDAGVDVIESRMPDAEGADYEDAREDGSNH